MSLEIILPALALIRIDDSASKTYKLRRYCALSRSDASSKADDKKHFRRRTSAHFLARAHFCVSVYRVNHAHAPVS